MPRVLPAQPSIIKPDTGVTAPICADNQELQMIRCNRTKDTAARHTHSLHTITRGVMSERPKHIHVSMQWSPSTLHDKSASMPETESSEGHPWITTTSESTHSIGCWCWCCWTWEANVKRYQRYQRYQQSGTILCWLRQTTSHHYIIYRILYMIRENRAVSLSLHNYFILLDCLFLTLNSSNPKQSWEPVVTHSSPTRT